MASPGTRRLPLLTGSLLAVGLVACNHTEPFGSGAAPSNGPLGSGSPLLLTYSAGQNRDPAWLSDQSGILYSFQQIDQPDLDYCIGELPPGGGTRFSEKCFTGDPTQQTTDVLEQPAPASGPGGRLAWVLARAPLGGRPTSRTIRTGTIGLLDTGKVVVTMPYTASSGQVHQTAFDLFWLGADTLVYVGADALYGAACPNCKLDSMVTGRDIVLLPLNGATPTPQVVPGTTSASSVWPSADRTALYYTLGGDTKVYRRAIASGAVSVVTDLDTLGITRDASVQDSVLVAIAGGSVTYNTDTVFDRLQVDSGGRLVRVDLRTGVPAILGDTLHRYRHARPSPDGRYIVTEGTPASGTQIPNLWLITVP
ncbi:MAG TPA: hypothetical protein VMG41_04185 [Gemmatimonadales bacterium]|nr:hypothetical protein [Gemmatimonadales bacterium]